MDLMYATVVQHDHGFCDLVADLHACPPGQVLLFRHLRPGARSTALVRDVPQRHADPQIFRPQLVHLRVAAVKQQQPLLRVEHAYALAQLVQGMVAQMHLHLQVVAPRPTPKTLIENYSHPDIHNDTPPRLDIRMCSNSLSFGEWPYSGSRAGPNHLNPSTSALSLWPTGLYQVGPGSKYRLGSNAASQDAQDATAARLRLAAADRRNQAALRPCCHRPARGARPCFQCVSVLCHLSWMPSRLSVKRTLTDSGPFVAYVAPGHAVRPR